MPWHRVIAVLLVGFAILSAALNLVRPDPVPETTALPSSGIPAWVGRRGPRLVVVSLEGAIRSGDPAFSGATVVRRRLVNAARSADVKGVLLTINSPGGTVAASQELYRAIQAVHAAGKPVVVSMGDVATSGGYYAASGADVIYANPGTLTGSIGVIISGFNAEELLKNLGIQPQTIKTGPFKDILSFSRPLTAPERELLQGLVDDSLDQFISDVVQGRQQQPAGDFREVLSETALQQRQSLTYQRVKALADGRILTGRQAQALGLVDVLGGYEAALQGLRSLVGDQEEKLPVSGDQPGLNRFLDLIGGAELDSWGQQFRLFPS